MPKNKTVGILRQGDVMLRRIDALSLPAKLDLIDRTDGKVILAYGEATDHHHHILDRAAGLWRDRENPARCYLMATDDVILLHQEHAPIHVPAGHYELIRQREYSPEAIRNVMD